VAARRRGIRYSLSMTTRNVAGHARVLPIRIEPPEGKEADVHTAIDASGPWAELRAGAGDGISPMPGAAFGGRRVVMVGIGGCGMSGMARILRERGAGVIGTDAARTPVTESLVADGIEVADEIGVQSVPDGAEVVIASAAVKPEHPLVLDAQRRGLPVLTYAEALGELTRESTAVAIAGTHGKSTTAAMLGAVLVDAGLDPSTIVGATCAQLTGGSLGSPVFAAPKGCRVGAARIPAGTYARRPGLLVAEACEYNRSFHSLRPTVASIGSVEADHLDVYGTLDAVVESFAEFASLIPPEASGGHLLIAHEGAHRREVASGLACRVETIGFSPEADWMVRYRAEDRRVVLSRHREPIAQWTMRMPGGHNAVNAATAAALACTLGADPELVARSLGAFRGLDRRCQYLGARGGEDGRGIRVYDDYGHHPSEVDATLRALRDLERPQDRGGRLICVFQPHQHSRTRFLLDEFASAFSQADIVIVPHIYFVRDSQAEKQRVTAGDLVDRLRGRGVRAMHLYPFEAIVEQLENVCLPDDVLVVMGAGPVWQVAHGFLGIKDLSAADARCEGTGALSTPHAPDR